MSSRPAVTVVEHHLVGVEEVRRKWTWLLGLCILTVVLGMIAIGASVFVTLATTVFFGSLMLLGGVLQTLHAISIRRWSGFYIDLLAGVLYTVIGLLVVLHPGATAVALTLLIAVFLIMGGIFRTVIGLSVHYQNRIWLVLHGVASLLLGLSILQGFPSSGLWAIGLFIGIDMLMNGWSLIMLSLALKSLPPSEA